MQNSKRPLLAVLIDADNISAKYASRIMREIVTIGEPALRRVYGDWTAESLQSWKQPIRALGLVAHQETANSTGENATDIGMVIHAMDILHSGKFDAFVIVSSDSDFTALVNRLREEGLTVIGIGEGKTNPALRNVYNRFILVENLEEEDIDEAGEANRVVLDEPPTVQDLNHAYQLVSNAIKRCDTDDEWVSLSELGQSLRAARPDFDPRSYGSAKLSGLIKRLRKLEFSSRDGHAQVRIKE